MPPRDKHIQQYKKNKTLANSKILKQPEYRDWSEEKQREMPILLFYFQ